MKGLKKYLSEARKDGYAIGHFNFATADVLKAVVQGAKDAGAPCVMVGTSEGEAGFLGMREAVALVKATAEDLQFPVFLNADHFRTFEKCKEAIDLGYDSVIIDPAPSLSADRREGADLERGKSQTIFEKQIEITRKVVDYAKSVDPHISVEGEIGYLKGASEVQTKVEISPADYTQPEQAKDFVVRTGVDRLAIVFGNIHGIVTEQEEHLDIGHFKKIISAEPNVNYVLHGASGLADDEVSEAIKAGIVNVHFNTELRVAYEKSLEANLNAKHDTTPYKYLGPAAEEVRKLVERKTRLFMDLE